MAKIAKTQKKINDSPIPSDEAIKAYIAAKKIGYKGKTISWKQAVTHIRGKTVKDLKKKLTSLRKKLKKVQKKSRTMKYKAFMCTLNNPQKGLKP